LLRVTRDENAAVNNPAGLNRPGPDEGRKRKSPPG